MATVIGIVSGKGGVGKTTLSINLGAAFTLLGEKANILDGDLKNPNVGIYLGLYRFSKTLNDFLKGDSDINEISYDYSGMRILPASLSLPDIHVGISRLRQSLEQLEGYVIVDFPPGLGRDTTSLMDVCDKCIIVTNPTIASLASTMRFVNIIRDADKPLAGIVVNRAGKKYEIATEDVEAIVPEKLLGVVPEDDDVRKSAMVKKTVIEYKPYSRASMAIMELAGNLLGKAYSKPRFSRLMNVMHSVM